MGLVAFALVNPAYAQSTVSTVAVTSDPGEDGGYAIGDTIEVGLTFSEAVIVTGTPQITLDVGRQARTANYSTGSGTVQLKFTYTVAAGDEDTYGIAVVANSLALNGGTIRVGATDATLAHAALQADDHKVDGVAPTVTVGEETRPYVPPGSQFDVVFFFSEKVYALTDSEITVINGTAHDVRAPAGNAMWPRYTRWEVSIQPAAEGPVTVTLPAGAAADAYGNGNTAPTSPLSVIAADPVMVEVTQTTSGFAEGGKAEFMVTRSRDNGAIPVSLSLAQTGDFLSGTVEVYPPPDPDMPEEPVTPTEVTFAETPFTLNITFAAGEISKRISVLTEDDTKDEDDGTVTLSVPAKPGQYKYIPGNAPSATANVRDDDVAPAVSLYWVSPAHPYDSTSTLNAALEGGSIELLVVGDAVEEPLVVTLSVTEVGSYLDLDGAGAAGYEVLQNGNLQVTIPTEQYFEQVSIPLVDNAAMEADGSVTVTVLEDPGRSYTPAASFNRRTIPVKDNDAASTVSISGGNDVTEGSQLSYTLTRTWALGQDQGQLIVNVQLAQTGDYITWPSGHQPDADGLVTMPVTITEGSLTATITLETVDDEVSEAAGSVTATILADTNGNYTVGTNSAITTELLDNDPPIVSVEAVAGEITEGTNAQYRFTRMGNTSGSLRVGLYVNGLTKIMTTATKAIVLTSDTEVPAQRLTINGASVDYILEFAAGESEKTLSLTTEADSVNEGDGWLAVSILQQNSVPYGIGTGSAEVHVNDDDIPTINLDRPMGPTGLTLSSDGTTWQGTIVEGTQFTYSSTCSGVTNFSADAAVNLDPISMWVQYSNHPAFFGENFQDNGLGYNRAGIHSLGLDCGGQTVTYGDHRFYVGPENGVLEIEILPPSELIPIDSDPESLRPRQFSEFIRQYEAAAAEAQAAGTLITKKNIFAPDSLGSYSSSSACNESDLKYCPQYEVGTVKKIRLTVTNSDPTILIKAESASVTEGQPARFIIERRWAADQMALATPQSETVVYLEASQDGQYITGALPTQITFGRNESSKVIELQTMDDSAVAANGSVTIELLPDTSTGSVNQNGKYTTWSNWLGHTPVGGRSDLATVSINNNDDKPGITIAPASVTEGDSGNTDMTFTLTLAQAVTEDVTVNYETSDGTATAGQDYTAVTSATVTIAANATTATFTVSVTGDETDEADETFTVTISLPVPEPDLNDEGDGEHPVAIAGGDTATVSGTIRDDDPMLITVAAASASVVEGEDVVFVLTRSQITDTPMRVAARLNRPGSQGRVVARFEAGAATTEFTVSTTDNDLVDYPGDRHYTLETLGDGNLLGIADNLYSAGDPASATVTVTDNDELQVVTVHASTTFALGGATDNFTFRRTGDTSQSLRVSYVQITADEDGSINVVNASITIAAGQSEHTGCHSCGFEFDSGIMITYHLKSGDGGFGGAHRQWQSGTPDSASITYGPKQAQQGLALNAQYPADTTVGASVDITLTVANYGAASTAAPVTVASSQNDSVGNPRLSCTIANAIPSDGTATCTATLSVVEADRARNLQLSATASAGAVTSRTVGIYMFVQNGMSVGFDDTARLQVTEPAHGAANAQASLKVNRVGRSDERVQVAYTIEPAHTRNRPYSPEEGADYADNSTTPGILTFEADETEKYITIDILGDQIDEQQELFRVTLVPPEGVLLQTDKENRAVSIVDRDPPEGTSYLPTASLELVSADPVPENAGTVDFAVVLDREWGLDARFEVEVDAHNNLTATPANTALGRTGDFEARLIHAVIPAGQTRFEFSIALHDDDVREEDETFKMLLGSSISKYLNRIGTDNEALATIADDDLV